MATKQSANGSFIKPTGNFAQISNDVLRSDKLSLKAKGLFSLICSYITLPNFTLYKDFLQNQCSEGRCAFDSAWKELVAAGFLQHKRLRKNDGTFSYSYVLVFKNEEKQEPDSACANIIKFPQPAEPCDCDESLCSSVQPVAENQPAVSYVYNKTISNNIKSVSDYDGDIVEKIKKQIDFDYFIQDEPSFATAGLVTTLLEYLLEINSCGSYLEKIMAKQVDSCFVHDFIEHIKSKPISDIRYPIPYWRKAFKNFLKETALQLSAI